MIKSAKLFHKHDLNLYPQKKMIMFTTTEWTRQQLLDMSSEHLSIHK